MNIGDQIDGVLVVGARGFVAGHLAASLAGRATWLAAIDRSGAALATGDSFATCIDADITDAVALRDAIQTVVSTHGSPELVFHLAAQASVAASFREPATTYLVNTVGTANLLTVLSDSVPNAKVLIPSSAHVYGPPTRADGVLDETSTVAPDNHYGASKAAQESVGRLFYELRHLRVYLTRAFNHVGPGQAPGFAFADFARRLAELERSGGGVMSVGNLEAQRDFLDVRDVVAAYLTVLRNGEPGIVYNVASGVARSMRQILDLFLTEVRVNVRVETDPTLLRPVDVPVLVGSADRLRALGWAPAYDIRNTIRDTLDYWRRRTAEEQATATSPTTEEAT